MTARAAFSLLETLLAAAILAMVVAACLPLLTQPAAALPLRPDPDLARFANPATSVVPPNLTIDHSPSAVAGEIEGSWVTVRAGDRIALTWIPARPIDQEGTP